MYLLFILVFFLQVHLLSSIKYLHKAVLGLRGLIQGLILIHIVLEGEETQTNKYPFIGVISLTGCLDLF